MTKLSKCRTPVVRETDTFERTHAIVVELCPRYMVVRFKRSTETYSVPYEAILDLGRKLDFRRNGGTRRIS